jgi:hypothetical protein
MKEVLLGLGAMFAMPIGAIIMIASVCVEGVDFQSFLINFIFGACVLVLGLACWHEYFEYIKGDH